MDEEKMEAAINSCLAMIRPNMKPEDALRFSQAVLNLANAKITWASVEKTPK